MHNCDRGHAPLVAQIGKILGQLSGCEHALVGDCAAGQRRKVDAGAGRFDFGCDGVGAFAQWVHQAVEVDAGGPDAVVFGCSDEKLGHVGHTTQRRHADLGTVRVHRNVAPAENFEGLIVRDAFDAAACCRTRHRILRHEAQPGGVRVAAVRGRWWQLEFDDSFEQFDRQLQEHAGTVAAVGLGARGTTVFEMLESQQTVGEDGMGSSATDIGDHGDTA